MTGTCSGAGLVVQPTGAVALLRACAGTIRAADDLEPGEAEIAAIFAAAADAFPIDHTEPPRDPRDRRLVLAVLALAQLTHQAQEDHR